ncbi:hypothetical protein [Robertmurraya massiliosenegalensis]|uniref:hypothetical protein n=1 Tax=Robertmurraya massiliosenegalensis TaxID=1287657 RepID=UPI000301727E|nr:hypothetical protein [Robertmurraya massiliosenegalensis]
MIAGVLAMIAAVLRFIAGILAIIAGILRLIAGVSRRIADLRYFYRFRSGIFYKICVLSWDCGAFVHDFAALGTYCTSTNNWLEASSSSFQWFSR